MNIAIFLSGITMATFSAAALFFIKFWRASGDHFFLKFSIACVLIAVERVATLFIPESFNPIRSSFEGAATWTYLIRLLAFILILNAVLIKNRSKTGK
jgi:hypothetical protein